MVSPADILNARILVVDDLKANVRLLEGMLRIAGYTSVDSTTDPTEVCELHRKNRYSLILLDLQMPGMDGFQVMEGLKEIEEDGYLPVLVITAQPAHKLRALEAGAKDFVSKPFDLAELRARVHNILEVRLLHLETKNYSKVLEETVRELEASREVIRLKTLEEQKTSEQELALAQETQESLLPRFLPQFENFRIHAFNSPTRYVGGDFYDFLQLSSGEWMGVLADVSGKGISAALLSSMVLGALSMEFHPDTEPQEVLNRVNRLLCEKSLPYQFVTLFLFRRFRLFSGLWGQVEAAAMEVDRVNEVLFVPKASRRVLHPLNLGIDRFAGCVGDAVPQVCDDVLEPPLEHPRHVDHRLQPTPHRPVVPPTEVLPRRTFVDVAV